MDNIVEAGQLEAVARGWREGVLPVAELTAGDRLDLVKFYFAEVAAQLREDQWRVRLSTLEGEDPIVAATRAAEWLVKGPAALSILDGSATPAQATLIEAEAGIITAISPTTPKASAEVAGEIAARFGVWVAAGSMLTALRRGAQHLIHAQESEEGCAAAFARASRAADAAIAAYHTGETRENVMAALLAALE